MEIRCRKGNCVNNTGSSCSAKAVKICEDTAKCDTFENDSAKKSVAIGKGNIFNVTKALPKKNTLNVPLTCKAKDCLFNKKEDCVANGIHVVDDGATSEKLGASCATFIHS